MRFGSWLGGPDHPGISREIILIGGMPFVCEKPEASAAFDFIFTSPIVRGASFQIPAKTTGLATAGKRIRPETRLRKLRKTSVLPVNIPETHARFFGWYD